MMENENRFSDNTTSGKAAQFNNVPDKTALRKDPYLRKPLRVSDIIHGLRKHIKMIAICAAAGLALGIVLSM